MDITKYATCMYLYDAIKRYHEEQTDMSTPRSLLRGKTVSQET